MEGNEAVRSLVGLGVKDETAGFPGLHPERTRLAADSMATSDPINHAWRLEIIVPSRANGRTRQRICLHVHLCLQ